MTKVTFNGEVFAREWIGRRASRWLKKNVFDPIGHKNLAVIIARGVSIIDSIPHETLLSLRGQIQDLAQSITEEDLYGWIPPDYRSIIEADPKGRAWASEEIKKLRAILLL